MITFGGIGQVVINLYYAAKNRTQMEVMEDFKNNIFDTGDIWENMKDVFGDTPHKILWLLPIESGQKSTDGHNFFFHYYSS